MNDQPRPLMPARLPGLLAAGLLALAVAAPSYARAEASAPGVLLEPLRPEVGGPIDLAHYHDPVIETPEPNRTFDPRLKPLWFSVLDQADASTRLEAVEAFQKVHAQGMPDLDDVPDRLAALVRDDASPPVRLAAAEVLLAMDHAAAAPVLLDRARTTRGDDFVLMADRALVQWEHAPARAWWLERVADEQASRTSRIGAMRALAAVGDADAVEPLRQIAVAPARPVDLRLAAATALGSLAAQGLVDHAQALHESADASVVDRLVAARMLAGHTDQFALSLLARLARDDDPTVASTAMANLNTLDASQAADLAPGLLDHADANVRLEAARAVASERSDEAVATLTGLLNDRAHAVRNFVRQTLEAYDTDAALSETVRDQLERTLAHDGAVIAYDRWRAMEQAALLAAALDHKPAAEPLAALLPDAAANVEGERRFAHDRPEVRLAAANALRVLAVPETLPAILARAERLTAAMRATMSGSAEASPSAEEMQQRRHHGYEATQLLLALGVMQHMPADDLLRQYVPKNSGFASEARSAAIWALGWLHADEPDNGLARSLAGRLSDQSMMEPEAEDVRRFSAIAIGRMGADSQASKLRQFYTSESQSYELRASCRWALEQVTGEAVAPLEAREGTASGWFLEPLD
ncbi:MAG: hypothetical protein WD534_04130 [Phycisphaeraceae bacterium]